MKFARQILRWSLLALTLAALCGCNTILGPVLSTGGGGGTVSPIRFSPDMLVVHADGTTSWTRIPPASWSNPADGLTEPGSAASQVQNTEQIDGSVGGKMRCGRFYLMVPAGAFDGTGAITMSMPDSTVMVCDLAISPSELNGFHKPVQLALCTNDSSAPTDTLTMYWYDPDRKQWVDLGCDKNLSSNPDYTAAPYPTNMAGVSTSLSHFSRYGGGKAGW